MLIPAGYSQIVALAGPKSLGDGTLGAIPSGTVLAIVQAESADVRWRDDQTDPTAGVGMVLAAGDVLQIDSYFSQFRFIQVTAGAKLNVTFYGAG